MLYGSVADQGPSSLRLNVQELQLKKCVARNIRYRYIFYRLMKEFQGPHLRSITLKNQIITQFGSRSEILVYRIYCKLFQIWPEIIFRKYMRLGKCLLFHGDILTVHM
jgi:hypothetical protein